ncbi:MAG TPA: TadE family type IV pilus minor pilin [Cellulomonadaceae bacterium]|nr:TadE family type IV pilus minor pilin [Cellulomonadaceae bacterium]
MRLRQTSRSRPGDDRGSATVELAIALPAVVAVLGAVLGVGAAAAAHLSCADGARAAAREAALGSSDAEVVAVAQHVAGPRATVAINRDAVWVRVEVRRPAVAWFDGIGGPLTATGSATARVEP